MAHSRLRKQSVLARSVELERSTSGAGEMLPGHCNDLIPCRARIYYDWRGETFEAEKRRARDVSAR